MPRRLPALLLVTVLCVCVALPWVPLAGCREAPPGPPPPAPPASPSDKPWSSVFTAEELEAELEGLPLDRFFDESWRMLSLRDPEAVVANGLAKAYNLDEPVLTDLSDAYVRETYAMDAAVLKLLRAYDRSTLSPEDQVSYDIYEWYLDDCVRQLEFIYYDYPVTFFTTNAVQWWTVHFFAELHPMRTKANAEDCVARLDRVYAKFNQLIDGLELRQQAGVVPPRGVVLEAIKDVRRLAAAPAEQTPFYQAFQQKLGGVSGLDESGRQALLAEAKQAIEVSVLPAYGALADCLDGLADVAPSAPGVSQFPKGTDYYRYLLRHYTTTEVTADEVASIGERELERIHAEMRVLFDRLGYPKDESLPELYNRVAKDGGYVPGNEVIETYYSIIRSAEQGLGDAFSKMPRTNVAVARSPMRGVYEAPAVDGSRPGTFWAGPATDPEESFAMRTLAYHETVPGHHLQLAYPLPDSLPDFRTLMGFGGFVEGWALYAEWLVWDMGWYRNDPYGDLGRLQAEAFRAARLVVDTGLHTKGWTKSQAISYFRDQTGFEDGDLMSPTEEISRYEVWPGQATSYYIGFLKFQELRQRAEAALGPEFDLREFHDVILGSGSMPLEVLERVVNDYIAAKGGG